jgi:hypothetical protein
MRFQAKTALGALVFLLAGALTCTPALAQQNPSNNATPPQQQGDSTQAEPGAPPAMPGTKVWVARAPGRGWAVWRSRHGRGWASAFGSNQFGLGELGLGRDLNGPLALAQRALRDPRIRQQLGISDQQAGQLQQQVTNFQKTMIQGYANLELQRIDLRNALAQEMPDKSAVNDALQKVNDAQLALQKAAVDFFFTLKQEIPPEQQQKIRQFLREWRQTGGNRNPPKPGSSSYAGSQPPDGSSYYTQNEQQYPPQWQNSQSEPEQSPPPQPYTRGEPQGSTPMTNNQ